MNDISLYYSGGSGGFFALHLILLAGEHECKFDNDVSFDEIFATQWNIMPGHWKANEAWPNNELTAKSAIKNKVYFYCNQFEVKSTTGKKLLIYTDLATQVELSFMKGANWFNYEDRRLITMYYDIKGDAAWPDIVDADDIYSLPTDIKAEFFTRANLNLYEDINLQIKLRDKQTLVQQILPYSIEYNGDTVDKSLTNLLVDPTIIKVKLQDIIITNGAALYNALELTQSAASNKFVDDYIELHRASRLLDAHL